MLDGRPVKTKHQWFHRRVPELKALFQHYMYGWFPPAVKVAGKITRIDTNFFNGRATLKLETLKIGKTGPEVHLLLVIPNHRKNPAPVFLGMNFGGNHTLVDDTNVAVPDAWMPTNIPRVHIANHHASESGRGKLADTWQLEQCIDRGYAVATYFCGDVQMDRTNAEGGVRQLIHVPTAPDDWGTIAAWSWGMERVIDFLGRDKDIDKRAIAVIGQSRFGKASILTGAFDARVVLSIPIQAGCGGTLSVRAKKGETVKQINRLPDWFCQEFHEFNDHPDRLPFDQDCLIALCAPRAVLLGEATKDHLTDPAGTFHMLQMAGVVYKFLGVDGLDATEMPPVNHLIDSNLGYFVGPGGHAPMTSNDWKFVLDFADKHLKR